MTEVRLPFGLGLALLHPEEPDKIPSEADAIRLIYHFEN